MPTYRTVNHGLQLSEALAEAAAIAPTGRAILHTFELRHPSLGAPVRLVHNHAGITAQLEAGAPVNASTYVDFLPSFLEITPPEESDTAATPSITVTVDNVAGQMSQALRAARNSLAVWEITERLYASDDLSGPALLPPLSLEISQMQISGAKLSLTASYGDHVNISVPKLTFKPTEYPGLTAR